MANNFDLSWYVSNREELGQYRLPLYSSRVEILRAVKERRFWRIKIDEEKLPVFLVLFKDESRADLYIRNGFSSAILTTTQLELYARGKFIRDLERSLSSLGIDKGAFFRSLEESKLTDNLQRKGLEKLLGLLKD